MRRLIVTAAILIYAGVLFADDPSEKGIPTSPLTVYSGGIAAGAMIPLNTELQNHSKTFMKLSLINQIYYKDRIGLFLDFDWLAPGKNFGADLGFDFFLTNSDFRPFLGMGVGAHYFDKTDDFGENLGPSATVHLGFVLDVTEQMQVRVRVPYMFVANETRDHSAGLEVGFLFSDRFRKVKKLNYN
ncbi:MAG: acyloxyacyl hydrolase [Fibrobacter sp.]|nr:acyloxyacyl hydrolase [Fibrobacter sp.]